MACKHERIKCVNCVKYCMICGEQLPADFIQKNAKKEAPAAEPEPKKETKPKARKGAK